MGDKIMNKIRWKVLSLNYKLSLQLRDNLYICEIKDKDGETKSKWESSQMAVAIEKAIDQL